MSDIRDPDRDQPLPVTNTRPYIQDLVIRDMEARKQHGIDKYGTALQAGNGRNMLQDAYEEVLDLCVYLKGCIEEQAMAQEGERLADEPEGWVADGEGVYDKGSS